MAEFHEGRAAKRARIAAHTSQQFAGPPRPSVEDVEDEGEEESNQPGHHGHNAVISRSDDRMQITSKAAEKKTEAGPSRVVQNPPQGFRNAQSGRS